jgi:hypothetical protein
MKAVPPLSDHWRCTPHLHTADFLRQFCVVLPALLVLLTPSPIHAASPTLAPWAKDHDPTDVAKTHVEEITAGQREYTITQGGTMDGRNCRSPMGCGINREGAFVQTWESNRAVRLENVGDTDVVNPWLSNGRNFRSMQEIVAHAITPDMTDAEKAYALWFQEIQYRHHSSGDNDELLDPVKVFNVYGYNTCGNDSIALASLWRAAGLKAAPAHALGHCISQALYNGSWHFYDGDMHSVYLLRDNETVASEQEIVRDHELIKRTHSQGILMPDTARDGQGMSAMYFYDGQTTGERGATSAATMNMTLRPGEALVWRWGHLDPVKFHSISQTAPVYEGTICNGLWEYRPNFSKSDVWRKGATSVENIRADADGLTAADGQKGTIVWTMRTPYVLVGGHLESEGAGAKFFVSTDGKTWQDANTDLDPFFPKFGTARYEYKIKCELAGGAHLRTLAIVNDLQMAPFALPDLAIGENKLTYSDQSPDERKMRITHEWVERSAVRPPAAPQAAVYPPAGGESDGTDIVFKWAPPSNADGAIADYQFQLSNRADMRWPLSMSFDKLISKTSDGEKAKSAGGHSIPGQYTVPQPGLLTPDKKYYWRVRAVNAKGVWGEWSPTWTFTARGPSYPVNVQISSDLSSNAGLTGILHWQANPIGRRPVKYRVYGSDEKGFTVADAPQPSIVGVTKDEMAAWNPMFPANFIAETTATELPVLGPAVTSSTANKTYYRVVAVDDSGKRSGPSDYATAPKPVIYSAPVVTAKPGAEYRYPIFVTRSLGDLSARMKNGQQVNGYFDIEQPRYTLDKAPSWLKIDEHTGVLSGTPDGAGSSNVTVTAHLEREVRKLDEPTLKWGNEKLLSDAKQEVGSATQSFVVDVK